MCYVLLFIIMTIQSIFNKDYNKQIDINEIELNNSSIKSSLNHIGNKDYIKPNDINKIDYSISS